MCRSIHNLRRAEPQSTTGDAQDAARQYVRKVSGFREPSKANMAAFEEAVHEVAAVTERLLAAVGTPLEVGASTWEERRRLTQEKAAAKAAAGS